MLKARTFRETISAHLSSPRSLPATMTPELGTNVAGFQSPGAGSSCSLPGKTPFQALLMVTKGNTPILLPWLSPRLRCLFQSNREPTVIHNFCPGSVFRPKMGGQKQLNTCTHPHNPAIEPCFFHSGRTEGYLLPFPLPNPLDHFG